MNKKRIFLWCCLLLVLVWTLTGAVLVIRASIRAFEHQLYFRHNNLSASSLFLSLFTRQTLFIIAFMIAVVLLTLHIFTATGIIDLLKCALLMFTAAGFDACLWNQDVLFLVSSRLRLFWMHTHDTMLVLFALTLLSMMIPRLVDRLTTRHTLFMLGNGLLALCAALLWFFAPVRAGVVLIPCSALLGLFTVVFLVLQLRAREKTHRYLESMMLLPVALVMLMRANYLFALGSRLRGIYLRGSGLVIVLFGAFASIYVLIWQLSNIFLQRSQNRRFEEVMKIKTDVSNLLVNYCRPPVRQITALSRLAMDQHNGELTQAQTQILFGIQDEANKLNRYLRNIGEFETLPSATPALQMQPIRLGTVFNYVLDEIHEPILMLDNAQTWQEQYAMGEPYSLIRANAQYCSAISEIRGDDLIHIACSQDGRFIQVELSLRFDPRYMNRARRICKIVNKGSLTAGVEASSDMALYSTHSIFSRHGCPPRAEILKGEETFILVCRYSIPYCSPADRAALLEERTQDNAVQPVDGNERQVLLFSVSSEEIELITSYLAYEPYGILVVTSEKALLHDLKRLRNISTLIIGSAFMDSSIHDICWMIREHYTLGQLPILLVQRDPDLSTHVAARKLANSVTTVLSDRFEFCQKVRTLVELQASVQSTYTSRLAFLQAQMNPHFIFNTMNTIMAMCLKDPMQAYDLLGYFSHYLRSSLFSRDLDRTYPVYEEVDLITAYLSIEKARFQDQIEYEIESNVPDDWFILPMLVEPLVENSVKHGKHGNSALHIRVCLAVEAEALSVLVEDDGAGFDPERQSHIAEDSDPYNRSIGLENVKARLKLFYNESLRIESAPGQGTRVSFVIRGQL